jgi:two-component system chemotaxis response regulator CheY
VNLKDARILVVEDIPLIRNEIGLLLEESGFSRINLVTNAVEALEYLETKPCDLVLCDWHLHSTMNGRDLLTKIRKDVKIGNTLFIVLTADSSLETVESAARHGADDYILKPFVRNHIESKVYGLLLRKIPFA